MKTTKNKINSPKKNQTKDQTILDKTVVLLRKYSTCKEIQNSAYNKELLQAKKP
jgi:hypothetical protein